MPTLIRLFVVLLVLAGLGFAGMIALTVMVDPGEKDITIKIPARDLVAASQPIDLSNLPAPANIAPKDASASSGEAPASTASTASSIPDIAVDEDASDSGVKTVDTNSE
jgi:hypothetical protein